MTKFYEQGCPYRVFLPEGEKVLICQCGHSKTPPLCDGSHKDYPGKAPLEHIIDARGRVSVCGCGKSEKMPYCDGAHKFIVKD